MIDGVMILKATIEEKPLLSPDIDSLGRDWSIVLPFDFSSSALVVKRLLRVAVV